MHISPEQQNARVEPGHNLNRNGRDDKAAGGPRARAIVVATAVSARAAQSSEPDRPSSAIEVEPGAMPDSLAVAAWQLFERRPDSA
jgi:hypothetical protein